MIIPTVRAWSPPDTIRELSERVAAELNATRVVRVLPHEPPDRWRIETDSRIGVLVGSDWELRIVPHLSVPKLFFLLSYSLDAHAWQSMPTAFEEERDLVVALASGFAWQADRAVEQGLLRGYVEIDERRRDPRGRLRFGDQLARLPGATIPLEVTYDEFTVDILENRLLRTAAERLLRLPRLPDAARRRLLRLRAVLDEASVLRPHGGVELPLDTRLNRHYRPALVLAKLVLDSSSLRQERGAVAATSFVFDMNEVFESFFYAAFRDAMRTHGGSVERQSRGWLDVAERELRLIADVVWRRGGRVEGVLDTKYKSLVNRTMPNGDAYQMLAYCIGLGLRRGFLVYAKDEAERNRFHTIKAHGYEIDVRAIDVEAEPERVLSQVRKVATDVAAVAPLHFDATMQ